MALYIEVEGQVLTATVTPKDKDPYERRSQQAWLFTDGSRYPLGFSLTLQDGQDAYPEGKYTFGPNTFSTDNYGGLQINRFRLDLKPIK